MNTQEIRDTIRDGSLTPRGLSDLALQLCTALDEARAEARHLAEYEIAAKSALGEVRTAHARADREAIRAVELQKRAEELEERCKYFLRADAWVRAKVERLLKLP